jgi:serine/threonine-protein kinase RsbT
VTIVAEAVRLTPVTLTVLRECDVSHARILATEMGGRIGFSSSQLYRLATAVSELGNNLVFHATRGGRLTLTPLVTGHRRGIEMVAEDDGPGIADIALAMTDGFSTNHGLGGGLPGSHRLMDEFAIASTFGVGTRIVTRLWR